MLRLNSRLPSRPGLVMLATIAILASLTATTVPGFAQSTIRVLVNDEPITTFDVQSRAAMLRLFSQGKQGEKEALEQLIDERLMLQEAKRRKVDVTDADVDNEFAQRATQVKLTPDRFNQALRQAGVNPETFREFLRANTAWSEIVRARFRATVEVTDQDIAVALTGRKTEGEPVTAYEYMLQQIIFVIPKEGSQGVEGQRQQEARAFRGAFKGCEQSLAQAGGKPGIVVKPSVRREENQITGKLKEAIKTLEVGGITEPDRVEEGIQLVAICEKREIPGQTQAAQEVKSELTSDRGKMMARRYLRDLRSDAVIDYR